MADLEVQSSPNDDLDGGEAGWEAGWEAGGEAGWKESPKLPLADQAFFDLRIESGFHQTTRVCLQKAQDAMLHHEWHKASQYMCHYFQAIEDTQFYIGQQHIEACWRMGTDILHHLPTTKMEHYNDFYEQMKLLGVHNYLLISLEHSFHLLVNGQIAEAKHQLSTAETWRYGRLVERQAPRVKLVQAYRSLLDYFIWCDKRKTFSLRAATSTDELAAIDMKAVYKKSTVNLKEILKNPGVWDPFILCYVEMLEHYQQHEAVSKVLKHYAYDESFPANPNAHLYLYRHLKKIAAPQKKLQRVLKVLQSLVPSHELMLEYIALLLTSDKDDDVQRALDVSLQMLDYACWKKNVVAWNTLKATIRKLKELHADGWSDILGEKMASRQNWWPAFHFTYIHAKDDQTTDPALLRAKAWLCKGLFPDSGYIIEWKTIKRNTTKNKELNPSPRKKIKITP